MNSYVLDIKEYNREIDDGMGDIQITVKANSCDVVLQQYEQLKKQLTDYYPVLRGNFKFENLELSRSLKVYVLYHYYLGIIFHF